MNELKLDPEFQQLFPELSSEQQRDLEADIIKNGCLQPLITWQGILVDGYHRYAICTKNNIPFETKELEFADKESVMLWTWSNQRNRRNCNPFGLAESALKFKTILKKMAKERQKEHGKTAPNRHKNTFDESSRVFNVRKELAKLAGTSEQTIERVEIILQEAPLETIEQLRRGETSINQAYQGCLQVRKQMSFNLKINEKFRILPPLTPAEYEGLERSIIEDGCIEAIVVWNDTIVDGHYRYEICKKHNIPFRTVNEQFDGKNEAKLWIIDNQLARKNISLAERIGLVEELVAIKALKQKAKEQPDARQIMQKLRFTP